MTAIRALENLDPAGGNAELTLALRRSSGMVFVTCSNMLGLFLTALNEGEVHSVVADG